jgi:hypothetical protein
MMIHGQRFHLNHAKFSNGIHRVAAFKEPIDAAFVFVKWGHTTSSIEGAEEPGQQKVTNLTKTRTLRSQVPIMAAMFKFQTSAIRRKVAPVLHPVQFLDYAIAVFSFSKIIPES